MTSAAILGRPIRRVAECASTNDLAQSLPAGAAVIAGLQTAGRGQYGRAWDAPPGSALLMSVACGALPWPAPVLTAWATVAVAEAIQALSGLDAVIKWPNDLLVDQRKLCGILIESGHQVVVGVGLNLARSRGEFLAAGLPDAGSIASESGVAVGVESAADALLAALNAWRPTPETLSDLKSAWGARLGLIGREAVAECADGAILTGRVRRIGFRGLEFEDGPVVALESVRRVRVKDSGR